MRPKRLSILGVGLLGGSIGLAWKQVSKSCTIIGYGHRPQSLQRAIDLGAIDLAAENLPDAVESADVIILCTPVGLFADILGKIGPHLRAGAVVTDVGSTKRSVVAEAQKLLPQTVHFVGSHPMAGSEKRGVEFARADLFQNAPCILTPVPATDPQALADVEEFWQLMGARTTRLSPEDHDQLIGNISHVPHAVAAALVAMQSDAALGLAGKGFLDATRIAAGDAGLWRDILLDNSDNVRAGLERLQLILAELIRQLQRGEGAEVKLWLENAARMRETLARS